MLSNVASNGVDVPQHILAEHSGLTPPSPSGISHLEFTWPDAGVAEEND